MKPKEPTSAIDALRSLTMPFDTPKLIKYVDSVGREFYLSDGLVTENGLPKIGVSRWEIEDIYRQIEREKGAPVGSLRPETFLEAHIAFRESDGKAGLCKYKHLEGEEEVDDSGFSLNIQPRNIYLLHLMLPSDAQTETPEYVLMDADKNQSVLTPSERGRLINPVKIYKEGGGRHMVVAKVSDLPVEIDGIYSQEDFDPNTGFFSADSKPKPLPCDGMMNTPIGRMEEHLRRIRNGEYILVSFDMCNDLCAIAVDPDSYLLTTVGLHKLSTTLWQPCFRAASTDPNIPASLKDDRGIEP